MGLFDIFKRKKTDQELAEERLAALFSSIPSGTSAPDPGPGLTEAQRARLEELSKPALALLRANTSGFNKLGGTPSWPQSLSWPTWQDEPLQFVAQLDLSTMETLPDGVDMPHKGYLYFFMDPEQLEWQDDDQNAWRILYHDGGNSEFDTCSWPDDLDDTNRLPEKHVSPSIVPTYPDTFDEVVQDMDLSERQHEEHMALSSEPFDREPCHQMFGHANPIQVNGLALQCQEMTLDFDPDDEEGFRKFKEGADDWLLLLQVDSDAELNLVWGDFGRIYYWIRKEDLAIGCFENVWVILQCS
jgi:uncharacterized protein YwqG